MEVDVLANLIANPYCYTENCTLEISNDRSMDDLFLLDLMYKKINEYKYDY
jgi:hypothetical protein